MSFVWLKTAAAPKQGALRRAKVAAAELADRAGTLYRLGFTQAAAAARLKARVAWEYDPPSSHGGPHQRPEALSDPAITKIVADTYARRPGGW
jgi:hypothetical protein